MVDAVTDLFSLSGKRALVVGGTRGIGRAIALEFARAGADVVASFVRERAPAEALAAEAAAAGLRLSVVKADASSDKGREELLQDLGVRFPTLDVLVFAAATGVHRPFEQLSARHFDFTFALNVRSFLALVQALTPRLTAGGSIVALSSEGAVHAMPHYTLVGASKGALEAMVRHLAAELAPRGIRVNVLSPGTVQTDAWNAMPNAEQRLAAAAARAPLGRLVTLEEVASAARFLASDAARGLIGHTLVVDGGARITGSG
jgi:NAD(P)-dependent dehydrogenase (short-subunit alcohol dehydrogenase family)